MNRVKGGLLFICLGLLTNLVFQGSARKEARPRSRSFASQRSSQKRSRSPWRDLSRKRSSSASRPVSKRARLTTSAQKVSPTSTTLKTATPSQKQSYLARSKLIRERIAKLRERIKANAASEQASFVGLDMVEVDIADIEKISEDRFTQSEAHLSEKSNRYLINKNYDVEMYLNIVSQVVAKEQEYKNTHYAFYHALDNVWISTQDVYKKLHAYLFPMTIGIDDFQFLRWGAIGYEGTAQEFLVDQLKNHGLVDDNKGSVQEFLISVNLALFGNVGYPGECTWDYFIKPKSHAQPNEAIFKSILDVFGIDHKWVKDLMKLSDLIKTKEQTLLQILVPIEKVDQIAYLSLVRGIPAHDPTINWVLKNVKSKRYSAVKPVLNKLTKIYKAQDVKNPAFKDLLDQVEKGNFSVNHLLKVYRNTPWEIDNINYLQARLLLSKDILLGPDSGVRFFKHSTITRKQKRAYDKALDRIISRIVEEFLQEKSQES